MLTQPPVFMLEQWRTVKTCQGVRVFRKVRRHPVKDDPDSGTVAVVHKIAKIVRRTKASGGGKVAGGLVSPGGIEGMLSHREQLDVGVPLLHHVFDQFMRERAVVLKPSPLLQPP